MKAATAVKKLAMDFRRWGTVATRRVQAMTKKRGVYFSYWVDYVRSG
jgi:hypothetical protein